MKKISDMRVLKSLIRDEKMAHKEYKELSKTVGEPMSSILMSMSADEQRHAENLERFKRHLLMRK